MSIYSFCLTTCVVAIGLSLSPADSRTSAAARTSAAMSPGQRLGHALVYDDRQERLVLFDGAWPAPTRTSSAEMWSFDGRRWELVSATGPSARDVGGVAFDTRRKKLVSYGGRIDGRGTSELWEWGVRSWERLADTTPGSRFHHAMAYDADRGRIVMYGGAVGGRWDTDTWEWDGVRWTKFAVPGPGMRAAFRMVYDNKRRHVVLFGGIGPPSSDGRPQRFLNDTWIWDGATWRKVNDDGPPARRDPSMAFDVRAGVVLLYGGASSERFTDMWQWDGSLWKEIQLSDPNPGHRYLSAMAYDAKRARTVLYGGYACERGIAQCGVVGDTWEWNGERWQRVSAP